MDIFKYFLAKAGRRDAAVDLIAEAKVQTKKDKEK